MPLDSWWLKLRRAEHHMIDVQKEATAYADRQPYRTYRVRNPTSQGQHWVYAVEMDPPDQDIVAMIGDLIHNLRSALDHVVVGHSNPRDRREGAACPIRTVDPWAKEGRRYISGDVESRKRFLSEISGLNDAARAIIIRAQPYQVTTPMLHVFGIISRLENADKHRRLIAVGAGIEDAFATIAFRGETVTRVYPWKLMKDRAEFPFSILSLPRPRPKETEVDVKIAGTAVIVLQVGGIPSDQGPSDFPLLATLQEAIDSTRRLVSEIASVG